MQILFPESYTSKMPNGHAWALFKFVMLAQEFSEVFPHLISAAGVPKLVKIGDVNWDSVDAAFCCLPHATTQETLASLPSNVKVVDLSADFRLKDVNTYAEWYAP